MDIFLNKIQREISNFHSSQLALFNVMACEKVLPIYSLFFQQEAWGNIRIFEEALITQYQFILNLPISESEIDNILEEIESNAPNLDEFSNGLASYALDACIIFSESINFLKMKKLEYSLSVASTSRDLVDMFIQEANNISPNDPALEVKIQENPFMKREVNRQLNLISQINSIQNISSQEIDKLRVINSKLGDIVDNILLIRLNK